MKRTIYLILAVCILLLLVPLNAGAKQNSFSWYCKKSASVSDCNNPKVLRLHLPYSHALPHSNTALQAEWLIPFSGFEYVWHPPSGTVK